MRSAESNTQSAFAPVLIVLMAGPACSRHGEQTTPAEVSAQSSTTEPPLAPATPIEIENRNAGTDDWLIQKPAINHEVEGYTTRVSVKAGETVSLNANVSKKGEVRWVLYRLGHYQGYGARRIASGDAKVLVPQSSCPVRPDTGLIECSWKPSFQVRVDPAAPSGEYFFKLVTSDGYESYVPLIVRENTPRAPVLFQASVTTWQAYNTWGGASLYQNQTPRRYGYVAERARRVSFDRPYEYARPLSEGAPGIELGAGQMFLAERWMIDWLEARGYDVAYTTNVDVDATPKTLQNRRLFMSVGHDEYWTLGERNALEHASNLGVSLAFFSANSGYWRIRLDPSSSGTPGRIVTCYKDRALDPKKNRVDTTEKFRLEPKARPENELIGVMYELWTNFDGFPWIVADPSHWVFEGTRVSRGESLGHLVGYEWDHLFANLKTPPNVRVLADSPAFGAYGSAANSNSTIYEPTPSSYVFAAGTIQWSWGLSRPGYTDWRVQRITENLLAHAGLRPAKISPAQNTEKSIETPSARTVELLAGDGKPGYRDGSGVTAEFNAPVGVAIGPDGAIYVTEARNHTLRRIATNHTVTTLAGCGPHGETYGSFREGRGLDACFSVPTGVAVNSDGSLFVSDSANHRIRRIDADGNVTTFAGKYAGNADGPRGKALFKYPRGLAITVGGALYVADAGNDAIRLIEDDKVTTVASGIREPTALALDAHRALYVLSSGEGRVYRISPDEQRVVVNQSGSFGDSVGVGSSVLLRPADGLVLDRSRLVFSDSGNYKIKTVVGAHIPMVATLAGTGAFGTALGPGSLSELVLPRGLAVSDDGYIAADSGNNRIVMVSREMDE